MPDPVTLDWRSAEHVGKTERKCRHCPGKTKLLDDQGRPSHKVCAENATVAPKTSSRPPAGRLH